MAKYGNSRFSSVAAANIKRSVFNRSHNHKTTFDANYLVPIFVDEVLPGDTFKMTNTTFCRLATPIKPSMDNLKMDVHFFFVPNRLVWDNWERFCGAQDNPDDTTDYLIPQLDARSVDAAAFENNIQDYFGIPKVLTDSPNALLVNALPFRGYNLIYNEWYRDQNLQDSVTVETGDTDLLSNYALLKRGKRHDYFTSALPFPQKGEPVSLSLAGEANVIATDTDHAGGDTALHMKRIGGGQASINHTLGIASGSGATKEAGEITGSFVEDVTPANLYAQLDDVTAVTINQLRQAFQLQKFLERDARSGTRYIEVIKSHFGVTNPDFRLQRPEYLGGCHEDIRFTTIAQTTQTLTDSTPQGNLAAMATVSGRKRAFNKSFTEHGFIIGIASVYADLTYQQGLNRFWQRETRVDHYWPVFAHLGEQEIFNSEIYAQGDDAVDKQVFGYQERYAEYRYHPNRISGEFRSDATASLDVWHYAEDFSALPVLNGAFIENNAPVKRNSAVQSEPDIIADFYFGLECVRPMPLYGTPGFVDHF